MKKFKKTCKEDEFYCPDIHEDILYDPYDNYQLDRQGYIEPALTSNGINKSYLSDYFERHNNLL